MNLRICTMGVAITALGFASADKSIAQTASQASGNWSNPATWTNGEPDGTAATTPTTIDDGHVVTIDSAGELGDLIDIGSASGETGTLEMTGGNLFLSDSGPVPDFSPSIRVGFAAGATGNFNMSGGNVFIDGGPDNGFAIADLIVGDNGDGNMNMTGGDLEATDEIIIGLQPTSTATVDVSGGTLRTSGRSILVGFDGNATLNVSDTGSVFANFDMFVGFVEGSVGELNVSGGNVEAGFMFSNFLSGGAGSTATINHTGGTFLARIAYVLGQGVGTTVMNHSGGAINAPTNNGDFVVSDGNGNTSTYNMSGTATVDVLNRFMVGVFEGSNGIVNQSGGAITAGIDVIVGRDGVGTYNMSGGTIDSANVFLGDFDSSTGTMKITGGTLNLSGNFNVGGALASNAAPDRVEPTGDPCGDPPAPGCGAQGQALDANGILIISGTGADINVGGNFRANPDDKSPFRSDPFVPGGDNSSTLVFEIFDSSGTSLIDVAGVADLDGAVIDLDLMSGFTPAANATFDLLEAASFGATGAGTTEDVGTGEGYTLAAEDVGVFSLAVVAGGGVETLRATFLGAAAGVPGDYNEDGTVNAADYTLWRDNLNGTGLPNEGGISPGTVDVADYNFWKSRFGATSGSGGGAAVPEPTAWMLLAVGAGLGLVWSRKKW